jgi:DNA repair exonuclease SbcCD ATPase subunit
MTEELTTPPDTSGDEALDEQISRLEVEHAELEGPGREPSWDELVENSAKYERELEARERRRSVLPRIIHAAKVRRAERQVERLEQELEPLRAERVEAYRALEEAQAAEREAKEGRNAAYGAWGVLQGRVLTKEDHIKCARRELHELRGEES